MAEVNNNLNNEEIITEEVVNQDNPDVSLGGVEKVDTQVNEVLDVNTDEKMDMQEPIGVDSPVVKEKVEEVPPTDEAKIGDKVYTGKDVKGFTPTQEKIAGVNVIEKKVEGVDLELEKQKKVDELSNLIKEGGKLEDIQDFIIKNKDYKTDFNKLLRDFFRNKLGVDFYKKYSNFSVEQLYDAEKNGDFVYGDDLYNVLPDNLKISYSEYRKMQQIGDVAGDGGVNLPEFDSYFKEVEGYLGSDLWAKYNAMINEESYKNLQSDITAKKDEIDIVNDEIRDVESLVENTHKGVPQNILNSIIRDKTNVLINHKNTLINEYNSKLAEFNNKKLDIQTAMDIAKFDEENNRLIYQSALSMYMNDKNNMAEMERVKLEEQNKILAEQRKFQYDVLLKDYDNQLKKEDKDKGEYKVDSKGRLLHIVGGVATPVTDALGNTVFTESTDLYEDKVIEGEDGIFYNFRTYKDGSKPDVYTYNMNGEMSNNGDKRIFELLKNIPDDGLQCGEAVNRYLSNTGVDFSWFGDSYESKKKNINSLVPEVGSVAIWNPGQNGSDYGHTGVVTGIIPEKGIIEITDWNWNGDEKKNVRKVYVDEIVNSDGGFFNIPAFTKAQSEFIENVDLEKGINDGQKEVMKDLGLSPGDIYVYKSQDLKMSDTEKAQISFAGDMLEVVKNLKRVKNRVQRNTSWAAQFIPGIGGQVTDFRSDVEYLKGKLTMNYLIELKNAGATFGALSNEELNMIAKSASQLDYGISSDKWVKLLSDLESKFEKVIYEGNKNKIDFGFIDYPKSVVEDDLLDEYQKYKNSNINYLNN